MYGYSHLRSVQGPCIHISAYCRAALERNFEMKFKTKEKKKKENRTEIDEENEDHREIKYDKTEI